MHKWKGLFLALRGWRSDVRTASLPAGLTAGRTKANRKKPKKIVQNPVKKRVEQLHKFFREHPEYEMPLFAKQNDVFEEDA